jgi:MFS family permease
MAPIAGRLSARVPVRVLMGLGLALVGCGLLLMSGLDAHSRWTSLLAGFVVAGAGIGMVNPALASTAVSVVAPERAGMASGINNTFRQVGIATGIAGLGALFEHLLTSRIPAAVGSVAAHIPSQALATGNPNVVTHGRAGPAAEVLRDRFLAGYTDALNELFVVGAVVAFAGAVFALCLVRRRDFVASGPPAPAAAA